MRPISKKTIIYTSMLMLGVMLSLLFTIRRLGGIYSSLWEDPIHYNYSWLSTTSLSHQQRDFSWLMRPVLEFALRKRLWFSKWGFTVTEQRLGLVGIIYTLIHLLLYVVLPWTPYIALRLVAVLLLGTCSLESAYSGEAQGYSFASLMSSAIFFCVWFACRAFIEKKPLKGWTILFLGLLLGLNSHYFLWPETFILMAAFAVFLFFQNDDVSARKQSAVIFLLGSALITILSLHANRSSFMSLLRNPPDGNAVVHYHLQSALPYLANSWRWMRIHPYIYLPIVILGLAHPRPLERFLAWGNFLTVLMGESLLITVMKAKSSYPIADRYLIMFIGPYLIAFLLGLDSIAAWVQKRSRFYAHGLTIMALMISGYFLVSWPDVVEQIGEGWGRHWSMPNNYSRSNHFFERVKAYQKPTLIINNHCWASDIPKFYMNYIGTKPQAGVTVLDAAGCETPPTALESGITQFLSTHKTDGIVGIYYESDALPNPCRSNKHYLYKGPFNGCFAIYPASQFSISDVIAEKS